MGKIFGISWSYSKDRTFKTCRRQFFFEYASRDELFASVAQVLRKTTSPAMLAGGVVDFVISSSLIAFRDDGEICSDLSSKGAALFSDWWDGSLAAAPKARNGIIPDGPLLLHHYLNIADDHQRKQLAITNAQLCLKNFEISPFWASLQSFKKVKWGAIRLHGSSELPPSFLLDSGLQVYAAYDFYVEKEDNLVIIDWKSGKVNPQSSKDALKQLAVYSLFGASTSGLGHMPDNIRTQAVFLSFQPPTWNPEPVDKKLMATVEADFNSASSELLTKIDFHSTWKHGSIYWAKKDNFPASPSAFACANCKFQSICEEGSALMGVTLPTAYEEDDFE